MSYVLCQAHDISQMTSLSSQILSVELQRMRQTFGLKDKVRNEVVKVGVQVVIVFMLVASPVVIYYACLEAGVSGMMMD